MDTEEINNMVIAITNENKTIGYKDREETGGEIKTIGDKCNQLFPLSLFTLIQLIIWMLNNW